MMGMTNSIWSLYDWMNRQQLKFQSTSTFSSENKLIFYRIEVSCPSSAFMSAQLLSGRPCQNISDWVCLVTNTTLIKSLARYKSDQVFIEFKYPIYLLKKAVYSANSRKQKIGVREASCQK